MEYLDVVNEKDEVIGKASKEDIYKKSLSHRIVHVLVFNGAGEMALQLRGKDVYYCPSHWCTSAGGHVKSGESYETAARRELKEECGIDTEIEFMYQDIYFHKETLKKFLSIFKAVYNEPLVMRNEEVERIEFFSIDKIKQMITAGEKVHPELAFIIENHF
ncbi:MAG: NUDIX domain-containing protein [Patescibacteria group bacterium]|jgi:isopentenyldiphosphate isomerase